MEPLTLLLWVAIIAACIVITALAAAVVWAVIQTMRGKTTKRADR